ncbi:MAG: hypothetical protein U0575_09615 [Phycisphaerales bacterium]
MNDLVVLLAWLAGAAFAGALVWLTWWAIFGDRRSGARRCPACWHDLSGTPGLTCGECGFAATDEHELHRARRRWRVAGLALVVLLAGASVVRWRTTDVGWTSLAPTRLLIAALPWTDGERSAVFGELGVRINAGELDAAQLDALFDRAIRGDGDGAPPSPAWANRYGPYLQWWRRGGAGFGTAAQHARLDALPPAVALRAPPVWPLDVPACLHLQVDDWWPIGTECRVTIRPRLDDAIETVVVRSAGDRPRNPLPVVVPAPPPGAASVDVEIAIERRLSDDDDVAAPDSPHGARERAAADGGGERGPRWAFVDRRVVSVPVGARAAVTDVLAPVNSESMTEQMREAFSQGLNRWPLGERRFGVRFNPYAVAGAEFEGLAIGLRVEILESGVPRRISSLWWNAPPDDSGQLSWEIVHEDGAALDRARNGDPRWTLRVSGAPEVALRALALRAPRRVDGGPDPGPTKSPPDSLVKYWAGSFEVPLAIVDRPGVAPRRAWRGDNGERAGGGREPRTQVR